MSRPVFSPDQVVALVKGVSDLTYAIYAVKWSIRPGETFPSDNFKYVKRTRDHLATAGVPDDIVFDLEQVIWKGNLVDTQKRLVDALSRTMFVDSG